MVYLFSFNFEKNTMNSYIVKWLKVQNINYFYNMQQIHADIFNTGDYYKLGIIDMPGNKKEVYAIAENIIKGTVEGKERAIVTDDYENTYVIKANYDDGDYIITRINGNYETIRKYYIGSFFCDSFSKEKICISIEFLETIK